MAKAKSDNRLCAECIDKYSGTKSCTNCPIEKRRLEKLKKLKLDLLK